MKYYKIRKFSHTNDYHWFEDDYQKVTVHVVDAMIRKAAKLTEFRAGDIVSYIELFNKAVAENQKHDIILFFREGGINHMDVVDEDVAAYYTDYDKTAQHYRLIHDPVSGDSQFYRVELMEM